MDALRELAIVGRDALKQGYLDFHGAPLSERQRRRKKGTKYVDDQLVGAEGPKMIEHIHAYVNGVQVD